MPLPKYDTRAARADRNVTNNWWRTVKMPFGKHKGLTMWQLVKAYPEYLRWIRDDKIEIQGEVGMALRAAILHLEQTEGR